MRKETTPGDLRNLTGAVSPVPHGKYRAQSSEQRIFTGALMTRRRQFRARGFGLAARAGNRPSTRQRYLPASRICIAYRGTGHKNPQSPPAFSTSGFFIAAMPLTRNHACHRLLYDLRITTIIVLIVDRVENDRSDKCGSNGFHQMPPHRIGN
jgi:hypothetical protein